MMIAEEYLGRSLLFRRLKNGSYGQLVERYAARLVELGLNPLQTERPPARLPRGIVKGTMPS